MFPESTPSPSRRDALAAGGKFAAASVLAGLSAAGVHADNTGETIQLALVGTGGRGTGAAMDAMSTSGPTKLVAMADVFESRMKTSHGELSKRKKDQVDVPSERQHIGFDGYKKAMDALKPGDVVILATPLAFRWVHFTYAIEKKLNVFMEKPVAADGPTCRKMFALAKEADKAGIKCAVGLMCRHCDARRALWQQIRDGRIGDISMMRAYRMAGPTASAFSTLKDWPKGTSELAFQIQRFHSFLWASGGAYSDFLIHNIDECCWMKDAWPVEARASGGRHFRGDNIDQNFDTYSVEYTFGDGAKLMLEGRCMTGCEQQFSSYATGTKGSAVISEGGHMPTNARTYKGFGFDEKNLDWKFGKPEPSPYQLEWDHFMEAIRKNTPYNEVHRGTEASLITAMGRLAAHTGQVITRDQMLAHTHEFAPTADKLTLESEAPIQIGKDGHYSVPEPAKKKVKVKVTRDGKEFTDPEYREF